MWPAEAVGSAVPFVFLLALAGWMPSGVDSAVWSSLWTLAKNDASGEPCSVETARQDFAVGYAGTGVLAFAFLTLGAGVMFGSGETFSPQGPLFSTQLVDLYSATLGAWTRPVVLVAVVTTMLSTALTVLDGGPRAIERSLLVLRARDLDPCPAAGGPIYWWSLAGVVLVTLLILALFIGNLTTMIDFATTLTLPDQPGARLSEPARGVLGRAAPRASARPGDAGPLLGGPRPARWNGAVLPAHVRGVTLPARELRRRRDDALDGEEAGVCVIESRVSAGQKPPACRSRRATTG